MSEGLIVGRGRANHHIMDDATSISYLQDPISQRLGYLLRRASSAMMTDLGSSLAKMGLRPVEATLLITIAANPGCIQSDLGKLLGIKRANMVPLIAALLKRGLIAKVPADGRSHALSLTPLGEEACAGAEKIIDQHEACFAALLSNQDQLRLRKALHLIARTAPASSPC